MLFVGQPQLLAQLDRTCGLEDRVSVKCLLKPLTEDETASYVHHRIQAAGAQDPVFDAAAIETLHAIARGVPRRINRLCDLALLIAYAEDRASVTSAQIESVAEEMVSVTPE